jgi:hypothetical protein
MKCANCGAEVPEGKGGHADGIGFVCCAHCVFNPLGCRCQYGQYEVAETMQNYYTDPDDGGGAIDGGEIGTGF